MEETYDVAIVGLGPAGATLARLLDGRFSVLALDRKRYGGFCDLVPEPGADAGEYDKALFWGDAPGFRKPCGGLLAPDAQKALARFGLSLPACLLADPQIFATRVMDLSSGRIRHYQRFYLNVHRHALDFWLRSLIPPAVTVVEAQCSGLERLAEGWRLHWRDESGQNQARARLIVGADGAASLVRRFLRPGHIPASGLALQQWFENRTARPFYYCIFDAQITPCYAWGLSKGPFFILGGAFEHKQAMASLEKLKQKLAGAGFELGHPLRTEACLVLRPGGPRDFFCGEQGAFLIGEAAGFISPSSLEGISFALDSARLLSDALNRAVPDGKAAAIHTDYARRSMRLRLRLLLKLGKAALIYSPFWRNLLLRCGLGSLEADEKTDAPPYQRRG